MYEPTPYLGGDIGEYLSRELQNIAQAANDAIDTLRFTVLNVAPPKPRAGDTARADGTNWNPGDGAGLFTYVGSAWKPVATPAGYLPLTEMTAPSAAPANGVRIYAEDNGAGKTRLMAQFATGAAQQLAIEP